MKKTIINPEFTKLMHENTSKSDHSVVVLKVELTRTKTGYKEKFLGMHSFSADIYEAIKCFGIDILEKTNDVS